ncbi:sulfurtransferase [Paenibacillus radicis (ex Xue et al. 2023)]|uniref:Sulfurtransferase n=1 Tax=Paenibacillus radicis (ex Xue et al. 2023) TaxID=2972489 RepID=A0ABT1YRS5_9BACL|nr:sulfurtransferase [Paenibacillus radicis (ex Xue et al. 2023)]MCR8635882.1 sulfurtransferase [Paenibacillus radicis (ex Xue et al. 2023)]
MSNTVSARWLSENLNNKELVVADCRFILGNPFAGKEAYESGHLPGAVYFDLEHDLSGTIEAHGGRHPLPKVNDLAIKLGNAGIDETKIVVAYDDQGGAMASRLWWILKYYGHDRVYVLDGGFTHWKSLGYEVTTELPAYSSSEFIPRLQEGWLLNAEQIRQRLEQADTILIDSREEKRYLGLEEPIDKMAGHIPGAVNYFWKNAFTAEGSLKETGELKELFNEVDGSKEIIVYCGSGVTACPNILALTEAGFTNVKLYGGSWSDWITYSDNPIATGSK